MNIQYLTISLFAPSLGLSMTIFYRPYVYENQVFDFWIADSIGSLVCVVAACNFFWSLKDYTNKERNSHILAGALVYSLIWEGATAVIDSRNIDYADIIAVWISAGITFMIKSRLNIQSQKGEIL